MSEKKRLQEELYRRVQEDLVDNVDVWQKRPYTAARVVVMFGSTLYVGLGFAKVNWPDAWDADGGRDLALRKACGDLARQILGR
jgi:hypothetical protein